MVVPLHDRRHLGVERADVPVLQDVALPAAELVQRLGDLLDAVADQVAPDVTALLLDPRGDLEIGVDGVAAVHEEVGLGPIAAYVVSPPSSSLIPKLWPQVSPDHTSEVGAAWIGAVLKLTRSVWPVAPSSEVNQIVASYSPAGREPVQLQPRGVVGARVGPGPRRIVRSSRPLLSSRTAIRPRPDGARPRARPSRW